VAANNGSCRREVPIAFKLDDGVLVEGIVDLAFRDHKESLIWTVVDYKTDFEVANRLEEYRRQVGLYALAISKATGARTEAVLLRI
jgi:ATP-dependent helicase/nuclease subunit A